MKKYSTLILVLVMLAALLTGCRSNRNDMDTNPGDTSTPTGGTTEDATNRNDMPGTSAPGDNGSNAPGTVTIPGSEGTIPGDMGTDGAGNGAAGNGAGVNGETGNGGDTTSKGNGTDGAQGESGIAGRIGGRMPGMQ